MNDLSRFRQLFQQRLLTIAALAALGAPLSIAACGGKVVVDANGGGGSGGSGGGSGGVPSSSSSSSSSSSGQPNITKCFTWPDNQPCPSQFDAYMYLDLTCDETVESEGTQEPGECCYEVAFSPDGCAVGRPFVVGDRLLAAPARRGTGEAWSAVATMPALDGLSADQRARLAEAWAKDALLEHASVASFGRFALELLAFGAPADLLRAAHEAAIDEVRHAQRCFALAGAYRGEAIAPGAFPFGGAVVLAGDLATLAESAVIEGCIGETLAALIAAEQLERASDPAVRAVLAGIAADEARHAELAWATVAWALRQGGAPVRSAVAAAFARAEKEHAAPARDAVDEALSAHGFLGAADREAARARALREVVLPCAKALLGDTSATDLCADLSV